MVTLRNDKGTLALSKPQPARLPNTLGKVGLQLQEMHEDELAEEGLRFGLRVQAVTPGGVAHKAGIRQGMILLRVDKAPVETLAQATEKLADANGRAELELRKRDGNKSWFVLNY